MDFLKRFLPVTCISFSVILISCLIDPKENDDEKKIDDPARIDTIIILRAPDSVWSSSISMDSITVKWNKVDSIDGYNVVLRNGSGNPIDTFLVQNTELKIGISVGNTYMVSVGTFKDTSSSSDMKNSPLIRVFQIRNPRNVRLVNSTINSGTIAFDATEDNNLGMHFWYRTYVRDQDGNKLDSIDIDSSARTTTITGLQVNKAYKISVVSVSDAGVTPIDSNCLCDTASIHYNFRKLPYLYVSTFTIPEISTDTTLVGVKGGMFLMGYLWGRDSVQIWETGPLHEVIISSFYIGKFEITANQYVTFLNAITSQISFNQTALLVGTDTLCDTGKAFWPLSYGGSVFKIKNGKENHPMAGIHWNGAAAYCNWLSKRNGLDTCYDADGNCDFSKNGYRLPTEAEFEYTASNAQSGHKQRFPWGFEWKMTEAAVNRDGPQPVGSYKALNGIYDLSGNVIEYMSDWSDAGSEATSYSPYYDECLKKGVVRDPRGPASQVQSLPHLMRGGSYETGISGNVVTYRYLNPCENLSDYGFRIARNEQ